MSITLQVTCVDFVATYPIFPAVGKDPHIGLGPVIMFPLRLIISISILGVSDSPPYTFMVSATSLGMALPRVFLISIYLQYIGIQVIYFSLQVFHRPMEGVFYVYIARNDIFSLKWIYYGPKGVILDYWGTLIFCLLSYYILSKNKGL